MKYPYVFVSFSYLLNGYSHFGSMIVSLDHLIEDFHDVDKLAQMAKAQILEKFLEGTQVTGIIILNIVRLPV